MNDNTSLFYTLTPCQVDGLSKDLFMRYAVDSVVVQRMGVTSVAGKLSAEMTLRRLETETLPSEARC